MLFIFLQIALAWIYGHFLEWFLHKYVLHALGKNKRNIFSFHYHDHHRNTRINDFVDPAYQNLPNFSLKNGMGKETAVLSGLVLLHIPLLFILPWAFGTLILAAASYMYAHIRCHNDPEWGRKHLPWHYAHHMAPNQEFNWGVRSDIFDRLFGTRRYYVGTEREKKDIERRRKAKANK